MNLVRGNLGETTSRSTPHTATKSHGGPRSAHRSGLRSGTNKELGNSVSAYARMDDDKIQSLADDIKLRDLKGGDVLKTTTTEVRFERMEDIDSVESGGRGKGLRRSSSSEVYIIDHDRA